MGHCLNLDFANRIALFAISIYRTQPNASRINILGSEEKFGFFNGDFSRKGYFKSYRKSDGKNSTESNLSLKL